MSPIRNRLSLSVTFQCVIWWVAPFLKCPAVTMVNHWFWKTQENVSLSTSAVGHLHILYDVQALLYSSVHTHHETERTPMWSLQRLSIHLFSLSVCKKEECDLQTHPACPAHRQLSVKKTKCCDVFECVCNCQNSTRTCPAGFITSSSTDDCGCTEIICLPDKVSVCLLAT